MLVGYARVSTQDQQLDLQQDALEKAGCSLLFTDVVSGATAERSGLKEALSYLREGDTLVVDTTNFTDKTGFRGSTPNLHVIERFTRVDGQTLLYRFTIDDPQTWTKPWTGEYTWPQSNGPIYEYACHEGNYAMKDILKGARLREKEEAAKTRAK